MMVSKAADDATSVLNLSARASTLAHTGVWLIFTIPIPPRPEVVPSSISATLTSQQLSDLITRDRFNWGGCDMCHGCNGTCEALYTTSVPHFTSSMKASRL